MGVSVAHRSRAFASQNFTDDAFAMLGKVRTNAAILASRSAGSAIIFLHLACIDSSSNPITETEGTTERPLTRDCDLLRSRHPTELSVILSLASFVGLP